ncbi:two-partner secretion domain-containing protein [Marinobacter salinexigens]|nr:MBG domain-containing protein [Marinobacter salinexigens]
MKATNRTVFTRSALAVAVSLASASSFGADLPTGGTITSGAGAISQSGDTLTVQQDSSRLISNWQSFNIGSGHTVNFQQPDNQAVALNRVIGEDASAIFGNLNANGKVFLINPNGVLFGQGASVNVGSLVASTLNLSDDDFLNERYTLRGDGDNAAVINRGHIQADNGAVALLGGHVSNQGVIQANMGSVALAAGNQVTLDFAGDGLLEVTVDESTIDALVENKELIRANGGQVLMTTKATDAVLETVVNNEGVIEAQTLQNQEGRILLLGGFDGGTVKVAGTLDASAPAALNTGGGDGGFIDTSGAHVDVADGTVVNTLAANGQTGEWLIDPTDIVIDPGSAVLDNLDTTDVTLDTASAGSDPGNITVNTDINWSAGTTLTLNADNIAINGDVSGAIGKLVLNAAGDIDVTGSVNLGVLDLISGNWAQVGASLASFSVNDFRLKEDTATFLRVLAGDGTTNPYQIFDVYGLQGMESQSLLGSDFVLANDIDASGTVNWHAGAGFDPIGISGQRFTGDFNGQGYIIDGLSIQRPTESLVGLFGTTNGARLRNVGLSDVSLVGYIGVGSLVGYAADTSIENSFASNGQVIAQFQAAGGLIGSGSGGGLQNSYADVAVRAEANGTFSGVAGGLLGSGSTNISNSYASGDVSSPGSEVGGLVGQYNGAGIISDSYATGQVSGSSAVGGVVGSMLDSASLSQVFWNQEANPGLNGVGSDAAATGVAGKTLTELQTLATFTGAGWDIDAEGGTGSVWRIYDGYTTPLLRGFLTALEVLPDYDGSGTHQNNIAGVDRTEWDAADASHLFGTPGSGDQLTLAGSDTAGEFLAYSDATANLYSDQQGYDLITTRTIVDNNVTNAGDIALTNGVSWDSGTLRIDTTGTITSIGAIDGGTGSVFDLISGSWTQVGASLPSFSVNDFRVKEDTATFLRALAGNGTGADPYQIFDVYGLQGMESRSLLNSDFVLANDIDASGTVNWHAGAGFDPIGTWVSGCSGTCFAGSFDGQGHETRGLTIDRSGQSYIGLFGTTAASATVANVGLVDSSITGYQQVGGLAGSNLGSIRQSYVSGTGSVSGESYVGGLVGANSGVNGASPEIRESYATVAVTGSGSDVGGLVGYNRHTVSQSYATGAVSGGRYVGGVIGSNDSGTVSQSYATGEVSGSSYVGGLIGYKFEGTVTGNFFATTDASGNPINAGLSGIGHDYDTFGGSNIGAAPKTLAELQTLTTFTAEGWDIDSEGGTGSVWRIYEGNTTPLLRAFLTELTVEATDTTYNGTYQNALWNIVGSYDANQVLGQIAGGGQDAGSYSVDMSGLYSTQQGYDLVADSNFVINKAAATVTANSDTVTYNGTGQSVTGFTATGLVNGEDESVLSGVITSGGSGTNAGSYTHTASGTDGNYTLTFVDGALTIDKAAATVTANSDTVTYNGTSQSVTGFTATGLVNGEDESVLSGVTTSGGTGTNAGSYTHTASGSDGNYILTFVDGALTIDKANATVTANSDTVTYNGTSQSVTGFTATGLVNGEDESVLSGVTSSGGTGTNAGEYTHSASGTADNYELTFVDGELIIDPASIQVSTTDVNRVYDGTTNADGTAVLVGGTLFGTDTLSGADFAFDDANAGTVKAVTVDNVTVTDGNGGNNYVVSTVNGTGSIGKRVLTAEVTAQNKVFDGTHNVTLSGLLNGLVTGDDVSLILDGFFASSLAGDDVPVSFTALLAGLDAQNYELILPAAVNADILEFRSSEAYQSAMVSRPSEERRLSLPEEPEFVLQIDEDALRMSR